MGTVSRILNNVGFKRIVIFSLIILALFSVRSMMNLILLTFIFSFLMDRLVNIVLKKIPMNRRVTVVVLYLGIVGCLSYSIIKYFPIIILEISQLIKQITHFYSQSHDNVILNYIVGILQKKELASYLEQGVSYLVKYFTNISEISIQVLLSLILSLFFLLEKPRLIDFTQKFKTSKLSSIYKEMDYFGRKFAQTFGKVLEAQFIIALVNCVLTTISLWILDFPQLIGLSIMIFFLGLIPVAGVIISLVPLCMIAYTIGGFIKVVYIIITIVIIHGIEAYILNPKLMSSKTNLPVFYTFIVLIFSEHFFGVWGLIIGIPVFVFLLDVLEVTGSTETKKLN